MKHIHTFESFANDTQSEAVNEGTFSRLPKDKKTGDDFYIAKKNLEQLYDAYIAGRDFDEKWFDETLKHLEAVKKAAKKFNKPEDVKGTVYESSTNKKTNIK